jgi:RNA polymerase sigma-70 factor (ECF subfamily)
MARERGKIPDHHAAELGLFFESHSSWLYGHAYLRLGQDQHIEARRELAADLVQETFEAAARDWPTLRDLGEKQQKKWLTTTLSHKEISQFRRRTSFRRKLPELHARYRGPAADTEQQALSEIALARAGNVIEGLPGKQYRIALMKWTEHMKNSEIAAELGCTENSVAAQVSHIRRKLIDGLGPYYPFAAEHGEGEGHLDGTRR